MSSRGFVSFVLAAVVASACSSDEPKGGASVQLLNVSYDPTRELYSEINAAFAASYQASNKISVTIK